ncbi:MAG TPA: mechanosensitive ion channel family protein [Gammaproteobacteria bacterium]|nr:mechanosensitive ion channel family protein [Gammaproteobacteria bacterium]
MATRLFPVLRVLLPGLLSLLLSLSVAAPALAGDGPDLQELGKQLTLYERELKKRRLDLDRLKELANEVTRIHGDATACVTNLTPQAKKLQANLESLGEPSAKDTPDVRRQRLDIRKQLVELERQLGTCKAMALRSEDLLKTINERTRDVLAHQLLARGPDVITLLRENWSQPPRWIAHTFRFLQKHSGLDLLAPLHWVILAIVLIMAVGSGMLIRYGLMRWITHKVWHPDEFASRFMQALLTTLAHYAPQLLGSTAAAILFYTVTHQLKPIPFITMVVVGLPPYFLFLAIVRLLLHPPAPARLFLNLPETLAHQLARRLKVLAILAYVGYLLFASLFAQSLPEPAILITRAVFAAILILNLIWAISLIMRLPIFARRLWLSALVHLSLGAALIIEWMGYRNLALTLARDIIGSLIALGFTILLLRLARDFYDILESGSSPWSYRIHRVMGIKETRKIPGIIWLRFLTGVAIWAGFAYVLLLVWDVSDTILLQIETLLTQGFTIGNLTIVPVKIGLALMTIALIILFGGWVRNRLENRWLKKTDMDRGAREAMVTITGYLFVALAFFIGLSVAGFEFQNLAIIAGALSVGIGFGLQNIVNNFISGLILLFERPIKTGDWIVVGDTEGYVKRIRIRSTQIQTFDRADVIVPNSELISSQVTNWMLKDERGRLRLSVGVAYGSDTDQVREILERIASEHPRVVTDGSLPKPRVLFRGFGDSSLDFELRAFIRNIDERLGVISDLNFAIDKAFREAGIEIPFPQRDIHVRDMPNAPAKPAQGRGTTTAGMQEVERSRMPEPRDE